MTYTINDKLNAYFSFFTEVGSGMININKEFKYLIDKYVQLAETYGFLSEEDEEENPQLSQLRMLEREFHECFQKVDAAMNALRDDMDNRIEFHEAMLEGMGIK